MATQKIQIKPVDKSGWKDFEKLFESKGAPKYCWCIAWRMDKEELKQNNSSSRKKFIKKRVNAETKGEKKYAKKNGAKFLEAYPVDPQSPSYRFMGFVKTFEKAGFNFVKKAGTRRQVMTLEL